MVRALLPPKTRFPYSLTDLHSEMKDFLESAFGEQDHTVRGIVPRINVSETNTHYEVTAELPGMKPEDIHVELNEGQLSISGERQAEAKGEGETFHRLESLYGQFRRVIAVPDTINAENIDAQFQHGLLSISLPKSEREVPKRIDIKVI
ncbi:MAG: heat-shock protein Hsp20 [Planctomycetaceae bacterium]|jgi:HSP20 family protein|nr:heat-shock protein Hsp20 [Planctomycetaceae bacterium]MBP63394.1 heat-shock protein Hsp20 [Planctomycetaceae bacterium]